jgi:hypothetical protein
MAMNRVHRVFEAARLLSRSSPRAIKSTPPRS